MAISKPPSFPASSSISMETLTHYNRYNRLVDEKGRYLPFDDFQYRVAHGDDPAIAWRFTRMARDSAIQRIEYRNEKGEQAGFNLTPGILATLELVDKYTTRLALDDIRRRLSASGAELAQLQIDEAITSSQLEGANTTTLVAREMLSTGRRARTEGEQMIAGNARLMAEIGEHLNEPLTVDLICHFHAVGMSGINDETYTPGLFRETDDIVIADRSGDIVHQPPVAANILRRLETVCEWANDTSGYIHPMIRACILHFMIAHEHPFRDGNGRTSRALFYWSMLKSGYEVFRYLSISSLLHNAAVKYAHSYQYTETDGMDLTYFLDYQASVITRVVNGLQEHINTLVNRRAVLDRRLFESGALSRLTQRQVTLLNVLLATPGKTFTSIETGGALGVSTQTARRDLRVLVAEGLVIAISANDQLTTYRANTEG
ncbi:hypothetical protein M979_3823 [Buttiauxella noackiae ATCC 51607]|uniref:Fido domain-containing protein n=1 Tax=Buttiauxella noackiae ATCC 51607 TaxID=1354255 RepID=A0A1B7HHX1_9ENTR|nr:Fic family protein [Buttiauxella noackiae]OAT15232.1 hypothetical protein M979_3823 [Buttiauxella noackiae ATCC 51607]